MALEVCSTSSVAGNSEEARKESESHYDVSILVFREETRNLISTLLNPRKVIPTKNGLLRDWRGLADLVGITSAELPALRSEKDPTNQLLTLWSKKSKDQSTVKKLLSYLKELDRFDIIDDTKLLIDADVEVFQDHNNQLQPLNLNSEIDKLILTHDDVIRVNQGLAPQRYDAFVLYAIEDTDFATLLVGTMEGEYNLKMCVKDRDLVGGSFEHDAVIKLIAERCNRLVVIISPAFMESSANTFFLKFAQAIGIEHNQRKIIPCLYQHLKVVPPEISCYFMLDYKRSGKLCNFWYKLHQSIQTSKTVQISSVIQASKPPQFGRSVSEQVPQQPSDFSVENQLRSSFNQKRLKVQKPVTKFNSMVSLNVEEAEVKPTDPGLNQSPSSSSLSAMSRKPEEAKGKSKGSWFKKLLPNKNDKKVEKKSEKKEEKSEKEEKKNAKEDKKNNKSIKAEDKNKMENAMTEKVHQKSKKNSRTLPIRRKIAIMNF